MRYLKPLGLFIIGWGAIACGTDMLIEAITLETGFYIFQSAMSLFGGLYCCGRSGWVGMDIRREDEKRRRLAQRGWGA